MRRPLFALMVLRGTIYGTVGPFISILLLRAGLPLALLGPIAAVGSVLALVAGPFWGRQGDRLGRRRMLALSMAITAFPLLGFASGSLEVVVIVNLAWAFVASAFVPLGDSLTLDRLRGARGEFARIRIGASIGYMTTVSVVGAIISFTALGWAAPGILGALVSLGTAALLGFRIGPDELRHGRGVAWDGEARPGAAPAPVATGAPAPVPTLTEQLRLHGRFLVGLVAIFSAANAPGIFVGPRIAELGGNAFEIGLAISAGVISELPALFFLRHVLRALGSRRTVLLGTILLGSSGLISALVASPLLVIVARLLFGAGFSFASLPTVAALAAAGGPRERASLTGLHFAAAAGGSIAVGLLGIPLVHGSGGTGLVLAAAALLGPVGGLIVLSGWPRPLVGEGAVFDAAEVVEDREAAIAGVGG